MTDQEFNIKTAEMKVKPPFYIDNGHIEQGFIWLEPKRELGAGF